MLKMQKLPFIFLAAFVIVVRLYTGAATGDGARRGLRSRALHEV